MDKMDPVAPREPTAPVPGRKRMWFRVLVGVSLALNLLVVGAVVGVLAFARTAGPDRPGADLRAAGRLPVAAMLPHEARRDLQSRLRNAEGRDRGSERDLADRLDAALRADPFSPDAVTGLFAERRSQRDGRAARVDAALVEVLTAMNPADRAAFASRMVRRHRNAPPPRP